MAPSNNQFHSLALTGPPSLRFGTFLKFLRHRHRIKQKEVMTYLPTWAEENYSRLENGDLFPPFDQLVPIACALELAGVEWSPSDRQQFLTLAREKIESKKTHRERKTEQEWDELRLRLARLNWDAHQHTAPPVGRVGSPPRLLETRHLVGREAWLAAVLACMQHDLPKKLLVLQGPVGIGKSSELHRLALHALNTDPRPQVLLCELPPVEPESGAESALDLLLATLLVEAGPPDTAILAASLEARMTFALTWLEKTARAVLLLVDNAEQALNEQGQLSGCWQRFLSTFLRSQHRACLVLATKEWPGWAEGERVFVAEYVVPSLSVEAGAQVLEQLGLASVASKHLRRVSQAVGGVPLCLEWVASLVQEPLLGEDWQGILEDAGAQMQQEARHREVLTRRLLHVLKDPSLFGGHVAAKLTPLLERMMHTRLSAEAIHLLNVLSLANLALGKPAVQSVCSHPRLLKELRDASLLMAYSQHVQVLPMVASLVRARLSPAQQQQGEEHLIDALTRWLHEGKASERDMGAIIAELARLYLKHHRLLDAAQLLIRYGWMSFNQGYAPRLARRATEVIESFDWHTTTEDNECGGLLLHYFLSPYLGKAIDAKKRFADYQRIYDAVLVGRVALQPVTEGHVTNDLMLYSINELRFEEAQALLETYRSRLEPLQGDNLDLQVSLLETHAWFFGRWCEYVQEQGNIPKAKELREQAISFYRQCSTLLSTNQESSPLKSCLLKRRLARAFNNLGYHLHRVSQFEDALQVVEYALALREQGYAEVGALAVSYGEKSEILTELGRFQEALLFDEKALEEIQRWANAGHTLSQEEVWVYRVNRGRLYLRLGRIEEAEKLLREALRHIHPKRRRVYRMFTENALEEIEQWRRQATSPHHQLDWRWVERYRELDAYDAYWWWASAGPFTPEEQDQWNRLFSANLDQASKDQVGTLLARSRDREVEAALREQRAPHLRYPALDIEEVRRRIAGFLQLNAEIAHDEPNAIVRRLYHGTIEDELCFIRAIEATYEADSERFWELNRLLNPPPTREEMQYALARVRQVVLLGLRRTDTIEVSKRVIQVMQEQLDLVLDLSEGKEHVLPLRSKETASSAQRQCMLSAQATQRFFETALREAGVDGWQVVLDASTGGARVDSAMRTLFLPDTPMHLETIRDYFIHELLGHMSRSLAGEHSLLALLGMNTKGYAPTEEGLALYHERTVKALYGEAYDDSGSWLGALAVGLASGVITPAQTFSRLFAFFEPFLLLYRLLWRSDEDRPTAEERAHKRALTRCLRTFRGVPDLERAGVCHTRDVVYLRGRLAIEQAVAQDETVLDRLAVGKVALELPPDLQELGIVSVPQTLRELAYAPDLDTYILSFEQAEEQS